MRIDFGAKLPADELFFGFNFSGTNVDPDNSAFINLALPTLNQCIAETWFVKTKCNTAQNDRIKVVQSGDFALLFLQVEELSSASFSALIENAYRDLRECANQMRFPHPIKIWNYFSRINDGAADRERYRQFCIGRSASEFAQYAACYPAATAIGSPWPTAPIQLVWLCSRIAGTPIENPRQTSAWNYPREFGPIAPEFSRAMLLADQAVPTLLISGTASVRGHATVHDDVGAQLEELCTNLEALVVQANLKMGQSSRQFSLQAGANMRVYLRNPIDLNRVDLHLRSVFGNQIGILYLQGDICRRDLKIEIEGALRAA